MNKKIILLLICAIFLTLGAVSAADNVTDNAVSVDHSTDNDIADVEENDILNTFNDDTLGDFGSYEELKEKIDNATEKDTVYLENDYYFDSYYDQITVDKELTIDGQGYEIDANDHSRLFYINGNNVVLKNIVFKNFNNNGNGGVLYWTGINGTIIDCTFIDCYGSNGGAVYWQGDNGEITGSTFEDNSAVTGGAVYWASPNGSITDSTFISNHANGNAGAVYWSGSNGEISGTNFKDNTADYNAGAVQWSGYNGLIETCDFNQNSAENDAGAVHWSESEGEITDCEFSDNSANNGGAVHWSGSDGEITDCEFSDNSANNGGAIYWSQYYNADIENCEFYSNDANNMGGAVYIGGSDSYIDSSTFDSNIASYGGAVYWDGEGTLIDSVFTNNVASSNGGAVYWEGNNGELNSTTFINNIASNSGGAVYWNADEGLIFDCDFTYNSAGKYGGALLWSSYGKISLCDFTNNKVLDGQGGAVYKTEYDSTEFSNCNFINNTATYGGAMTIETCDYDSITDCIFNNNHAQFGDAIEWYDYLCAITDTRFNNEITGYDKYFYINNKLIPTFNIRADDINLGRVLNLGIDFISYDESMCGNIEVSIINIYTNLIVYNSVQDLSEEVELLIQSLKTGIYEIQVNYTGDNVYESVLKTRVFEVSGLESSIDFTVKDIKWGEELVLTPVLSNGAVGFIEIYVDGIYEDKFQVGNKYTLKGLGGPYSDITLVYLGSDNYKPSEKTKRVYVERLNSTLNLPEKVESGNPSLIEIGLNKDAEGLIKVVFDGATYKGYVSDGKFSFEASELTSGNKTMIIMYDGDSKYDSFTKSYLIDVSLKIPVLHLTANNALHGNNIVVTPYIEGANGQFEIYVNGEYIRTISSSNTYTMGNPGLGKYDIKVVFKGDDYYGKCENTTSARVYEFYPIIISNPAVVYNGGRYFNATFYDEYGDALVNKLVTFSVDGTDYVARTNANGTAVLRQNFKIGNYTMTIINTVVNERLSGPFKVYSSIDSKDMTRAYNTGADYTVTILGEDGNPLVKGWAIFNVNNKDYTVLTDNFGNATLNAKLLPGTYTITTTNPLTGESKKNTLKIVSTVSASDTVRGYNSGSDFEATFVNVYNQALVNQKVTFIVNCTEYVLSTDAKGHAVLNEKLAAGKYRVEIINPVTGEVAVKNLTIVGRISENKDVVCIPGQNTYYTMRIIGDDGKAVGSNEIVKITVNDVTSQIKTDNNGYASFKIPQLNMGLYKIYAEYKGYSVNNTVSILQKVDNIRIIETTDINFKQAETITVRFNSFDYNANVEVIISGANGYNKVEKFLAHDPISLTLSDLNASRYTVTVNYYDVNNFRFNTLAKTFNVLKINPNMTVAVGNANVGEDATITVTIPDVTGDVSIRVGNRIVYNGPISNGKVSKSINDLAMGVYPVYVTYNGNGNYNSITKTDTLIITQNKVLTNIAAQDISMKTGQSAYLTAKLTDQYGNAISRENVTITFNGAVHTLTTGADGTVKLLIKDVAAKTYSAQIAFAGDSYYSGSSKTVKVVVTKTEKVSLTLKKVTVKKSAKKLVLTATLKINGKAVYGKKIKFKFNKKTYAAKTNKKGVAKVTVKKNVLKKLKKGKKVTYQASYSKTTVKKTVKVK